MSRSTLKIGFLLIALCCLLPVLPSLLRHETFTFRDHHDYFVPLRFFTAESLRSGELPLWNPYNGSGEPWLANPQTAVFYPPAWLMVAFPFPSGYQLFLAFHLFILGAGAFLLFRRWSDPGPSLLAATVLMLCGPTLSLLDVNNNLATFCWYPLAWWCASERRTAQPRVPAAAGAVVIMLMFLGGEPYLALIGASLYAVILVSFRLTGRALMELALVAFSAVLLSAVQLFPFLEMLPGSDRSASAPPQFAYASSLLPSDWIGVPLSPALVPGLEFLRGSQYFIPSLYGGAALTAAVLLSLLVLATRGVGAAVRVRIAGLGLLFLIMMLLAAGQHLPWMATLVRNLHLDFTRYSARHATVAMMALAGLAACGFQELANVRRALRLIAAALLGILLCTAAVMFLPSKDLIAARVVFPSIVLIGTITVLIRRPEALRSWRFAIFASAAVAIDLLLAAQPLLQSAPFSPSLGRHAGVIAENFKVIRLQGNQEQGLRREEWLAGYLNLLDRKYDSATPAPVIDLHYLQLHQRLLSTPRLDLLDFLSIGYVLTSRSLRVPHLALLTDGRVKVYRNRQAMPFATFWTGYRIASSDAEGRRALLEGTIDPRATLLVTGASLPRNGSREGTRVAAQWPTTIGLGKAVVEVEVEKPGVLVLHQRDAEGWHVRVDSMPATPLRAFGMFRAVEVSRGSHVVEWTYHPRSLRLGAWVTALGMAFVLANLVLFVRRRREAEARA